MCHEFAPRCLYGCRVLQIVGNFIDSIVHHIQIIKILMITQCHSRVIHQNVIDILHVLHVFYIVIHCFSIIDVIIFIIESFT